MKRGELYRVAHPTQSDPKRFRTFVVVARQVAIDSRLSTVVCAPIYTSPTVSRRRCSSVSSRA